MSRDRCHGPHDRSTVRNPAMTQRSDPASMMPLVLLALGNQEAWRDVACSLLHRQREDASETVTLANPVVEVQAVAASWWVCPADCLFSALPAPPAAAHAPTPHRRWVLKLRRLLWLDLLFLLVLGRGDLHILGQRLPKPWANCSQYLGNGCPMLINT